MDAPHAHGPARRRLHVVGVLLIATALATTTVLAGPATAVPADPQPYRLTQPDGDSFSARRFGDEWYNGVETARGHTILQGPRGWWRYAERAADGSLGLSGSVVGRDTPPDRRHLRDRVEQRRGERLRSMRVVPKVDDVLPEAGGPEAAPALGTDRSLVILVQFLDQASVGTTAAQWSSAYFGAGKSVRDYYAKASGGQFTLAPAAEVSGTANDGVVGWLTLNRNHPNTTEITDDNRAVTRAAIEAANPYVDYAAFDANGDGQLTNRELHVTVIVAGQEASCCSAWGKSVWGHKWQLTNAGTPNVDGKWLGNWGYTQFGEMHGDHMAVLGIMAHEIGHDLGLPDLYDTDRSSDGVGLWSVMGGGSWLKTAADAHAGQTPPLPDAWTRWNLGWITPTQVEGTQTVSINAAASGTSGVAVQLLDNPGGPGDWTWNNLGSGQYFLVENRQRIAGSYDESLPGNGLLVMHVDESKGSNATDGARLVDVEEADGLAELDVYQGDNGDAGDLFPGTSGNRTFGAGTNPNSNLINGTASGVAIGSISDSATTMSATFTAPGGTATPPANDHFAQSSTVSTRIFDATVDTTAATIETGEFSQAGCPLGRTVWYRYAPTRDVLMRASTSGSSFDTVLNVWRGTSLAGLTAVACSDDVTGTDRTSQLAEFVAQAGQTYYLQAGGYFDSAAGTVDSGALQLHVRARPLNDDFNRARVISGANGTATGDNVNASKETGEAAHAGNTGGASVWWQWTAPSSGPVTFDTVGSAAADTLLAVYTGSAVNATTQVAANDDITPGTDTKSRVTFTAVAGTTYRIAVDGFGTAAANRGELALNWASGTTSTTDLGVTLAARDLPGHTFGYRAVVTRTGADDPGSVTAVLDLPSTVTLTDWPNACDGGQSLTCEIGVVEVGSPVMLDITVRPRTPGPHLAEVGLTGDDASASAVASIGTVCDNTPTNGSDGITGSASADVLCGLDGDDVIAGNGGDDLIFGGPGFDIVSYANASGPMVVNLGFQNLTSETAWPRGGAPADGNDLVTEVEGVRGTRFADQLVGRKRGSDLVVAMGGSDLLYGYGGRDALYGGGGRDRLFGGSGADELYGGRKVDRLDGGRRRDLCRDRRDVKRSCER